MKRIISEINKQIRFHEEENNIYGIRSLNYIKELIQKKGRDINGR